MRSRFSWTVFRGRCRRRLLAGLVLFALAAGYAAYAGYGLGQRGRDATMIDQPLVHMARQLTPPPFHLRGLEPQNSRELYLVTAISDQQDTLHGLTLLVLRLIVAITFGGFGLVLVTAGATEWELRSGAGE